MKHVSHLSLLLGLSFASLQAQQPASPAKPAEKEDYFAKVVIQANKLLAPHIKTAPLPVPLPNPFREPGAVEPEAPVADTETVPVLSGSALLNKLTAELRVTGMMNVGGRSSLIINGTPRREGDTITVKSGAATYYLFFKKLGNGTATFTLDGAESTIRVRVN
jgi:hypothetical protein